MNLSPKKSREKKKRKRKEHLCILLFILRVWIPDMWQSRRQQKAPQ